MRLALGLCLTAAVLSAACGSSSAAAPVSPGPVTLAITALQPNADVCWTAPHGARDKPICGMDAAVPYEGDPMPIAIGCDRRLGVTIDVTKFYLRAPDACDGAPQCGFLDIDLYDSSFTTLEASARGVALTLLLKLDSLDLAAPSDHLLVPSLLRPDGSVFKGPYSTDPAPLAVTLESVAGCSTDEPSGTGGAGGDGNAAGGAAP